MFIPLRTPTVDFLVLRRLSVSRGRLNGTSVIRPKRASGTRECIDHTSQPVRTGKSDDALLPTPRRDPPDNLCSREGRYARSRRQVTLPSTNAVCTTKVIAKVHARDNIHPASPDEYAPLPSQWCSGDHRRWHCNLVHAQRPKDDSHSCRLCSAPILEVLVQRANHDIRLTGR